MPFFFHKISQLTKKDSADRDDLLEVSTKNGTSYESKSVSVGQIADATATSFEYDSLVTTDKTLVGAINDVAQGHTTIDVTPIQTTGDHIADVTVNGTTTELYAPQITANPTQETTYPALNTISVDGVTYALNRPIIHGFHIDSTESDPDSAVTYLLDSIGMTPVYMDFANDTFNYGSWGDVWFIKQCKPCILNGNGQVVTYLDPMDYTKDLDGNTVTIDGTLPSGSNVMIEFPKIWYKIVSDPGDSTSGSIYVCETQADSGFVAYPYIRLSGGMNDKMYFPAYNISGNSTLVRSVSNAQYCEIDEFSDEISAYEANGSTYHMPTLSEITIIDILLVLISKSLNSQSKFGIGLTTGGTSAINDGFRTGVQNDKGLFYGTNSGDASVYTNAVKVFGIENFWGFTERRILGYIFKNDNSYIKMCLGQTDGSTTDYYNTDGTGYIEVQSTPTGTSGNYIKSFLLTNSTMLPYNVPSSGSSSSTYYCDNMTQDYGDIKNLSVGGNSRNGYGDGVFQRSLFNINGNGNVFNVDFTPIISVTDALAKPAIDLQCKITAIQEGSGDPSPQNIRPISGWTGANLFGCGKNLIKISADNEARKNGNPHLIYGENNSCTIDVNNVGSYYVCWELTDRVPESWRNTRLTISEAITGTFCRFVWCDDWSGSLEDHTSSTININDSILGKKLGLRFFNNTGRPQTISKTQIEVGSTATDYTPYITPSVYPVTWQTEAGTIFGGEVDFVRGKVKVVNPIYQFTGEETIYYSEYLGNGRFSAIVLTDAKSGTNVPIACSHYKPSTAPVYANNANNNICAYENLVFWRDDSIANETDMKTYLAQQYANGTPVSVVFTLATPIEYNITQTDIPLLLGNNTLWCNTGDTALTYMAKKG